MHEDLVLRHCQLLAQRVLLQQVAEVKQGLKVDLFDLDPDERLLRLNRQELRLSSRKWGARAVSPVVNFLLGSLI